MIIKFCFITLCVLVSTIYFLPSELKIIYLNYFENDLNSGLIIPVENKSKKSLNNSYDTPRTGERKHEGIDIFAYRGTAILNAKEGFLIYRGRNILGGNVIKIFGTDKRIYYYAHMDSSIEIERGNRIKQGEIIGYVGNTGNAISTPPHLHFEIMEISWLFPLITKNINPYYEFR